MNDCIKYCEIFSQQLFTCVSPKKTTKAKIENPMMFGWTNFDSSLCPLSLGALLFCWLETITSILTPPSYLDC